MKKSTMLLTEEEGHKIFDEVVKALKTITKSSKATVTLKPAELASGVYRLLPNKTGIEYIFVGISLQIIFNDFLNDHV
jgi:hypothetical protein